jgi:type III secretion protein O
MNADVIRPLLRIKTLRADRAEDEHRQRRAVYNAALAAAETAQQTLEEWRADMPRKEAAIYDEVIGRVVDLEALDAVQERLVQLREHERLLQQRVIDAQAAARDALKAADEAAALSAQARRNVSKFEEIVDMLRRADLAEAERREDLELEEFAKAAGSNGADDESGDGDEWDYAA